MTFSFFTRFTLAATLLAGASAKAADPLPIQATTTAGKSNPGYLQKADASGFVISATPDGANAVTLPYETIADVSVDEPRGWSQAVSYLQGGAYVEAEAAFRQLAEDYSNIVAWEDGYGSLARLNHFKAIRSLGKLEELAAAMDRQLANPLSLSAFYQIEFNELKGWALLGKNDLLQLESFINNFQVELPSRNSLLPAFKPLPGQLVASLAYLRGVLHERQQKPDLALVDFHTAMTYNFGNNPSIYEMSATASLKILATKLKAKPDDLPLKRRAHALATIYRDVVGQGEVAAEFAPFLEPLPEPEMAEEEEEKADS